MGMIGNLLTLVGFVIAMVGGIWILVIAFQESVLWGLLCLFCNIISLYYVITRWEKSKKPFLIELGGAVLCAIGQGIAHSGGN